MADGHGGKREGAGRPFREPEMVDLGEFDDPLEFFKAVMNCTDIEMRLREDAAKTLASYVHAKPGQKGKKDQKQDEAKEAGKGKFGLRSIK